MSDEIESDAILTPQILIEFLKKNMTLTVRVDDIATYGSSIDLNVSVQIKIGNEIITRDDSTFHGITSCDRSHYD